MLSKNDIKLYRSLKQKKYRREHNLFVIEGKKGIEEAVNSNLEIITILTSNENQFKDNKKVQFTSKKNIAAISALKNAPDALCIAKIPISLELDINKLKDDLILILDELQDPGNLGTIIRIADWFGIKQIVCSENTVDVFNTKTIQASMGSFSRVHVNYTDLEKFITLYKEETSNSIFSTVLDGDNIYKTELSSKGAIVIGNEGNGISKEIAKLSSHMITIPKLGKAESLNAGIATALVCAQFRNQ